jgi:cytidine deaminase
MSKIHRIKSIIYDKRGMVLSIGENFYQRSHPHQARHAEKVGESYKIFLHSEIHAITRLPYLAKAHRILITRYDAKGDPALAAPCRICRSAISETPIKVIQYTTVDGIYEENITDWS